MSDSRVRRWAVLAGVVLVATAIWAGWDGIQAFDWKAFGSVYRSMAWGWVALSSVLVLGTYWARVVRWRMMTAPVAPDASSHRIFKATAIGFSAVILMGRPGELVRPWLISRSEKVSFPSQMAIWFLERVFDLLAVLVLFGLGLWAYEPRGQYISPGVQWMLNASGGLVAGLATACVGILYFAGRSGESAGQRLTEALAFLPEPWRERTAGIGRSFSDGLRCCRRPSDMASLLAVTAVEWLIITGGTISFFRAFPQTGEFGGLDSVVYIGFVAFGSIVQIPGVGGGIQLAGTVVLSQLFGLGAGEAAGIAVANWLVTWVSILPLGGWYAAQAGLRWKNLRRISQDLKNQEIAS